MKSQVFVTLLQLIQHFSCNLGVLLIQFPLMGVQTKKGEIWS